MYPTSPDSLPSGHGVQRTCYPRSLSEDSWSGMTIIAQGQSYHHSYVPAKLPVVLLHWVTCAITSKLIVTTLALRSGVSWMTPSHRLHSHSEFFLKSLMLSWCDEIWRFRRQRQEEFEFRSSLSYIVRPFLRTQESGTREEGLRSTGGP